MGGNERGEAGRSQLPRRKTRLPERGGGRALPERIPPPVPTGRGPGGGSRGTPAAPVRAPQRSERPRHPSRDRVGMRCARCLRQEQPRQAVPASSSSPFCFPSRPPFSLPRYRRKAVSGRAQLFPMPGLAPITPREFFGKQRATCCQHSLAHFLTPFVTRALAGGENASVCAPAKKPS